MRKASALLRELHSVLRDANIYGLFGVVGLLALLGAVGFWALEDETFFEALWWSIVTLATVGYGDISPVTTGGRVVAVMLMLGGIGMLGAFTAQIASLLFERQWLKQKGRFMHLDFRDHVIFSGWSPRAETVLRNLRGDPRGAALDVLLIARLDEVPVDDDRLYFIRGTTDERTLRQAHLPEADTVVLFGDPSLDEEARDAKVILHALTVEDINPDVYTIVELAHTSSQSYCERAHVDEIIVGSEFASRLLSRAVVDHGITEVFSDLVSARHGNEIFELPLEEKHVGMRFEEALLALKRDHDCLVVGLEEQTGADGRAHVVTNPPADRTLKRTDRFIVIGEDAPEHVRPG